VSSGSLVTELDHSTLKSDSALQTALATFAKKPLHSQLYQRLNPPDREPHAPKRTVTRFVVLKALEKVPPSLQMALVHRLGEVEELGLRFILLADDAKSVLARAARLLALAWSRLSAGQLRQPGFSNLVGVFGRAGGRSAAREPLGGPFHGPALQPLARAAPHRVRRAARELPHERPRGRGGRHPQRA
jgi:hypothetical protein